MGRFQAWLVDFIINRTPIVSDLLKFLDGHKTLVGRMGVLISSILTAVQALWPEYTVIPQIYSAWMVVITYLFEKLGLAHKVIKGEIEINKTKKADSDA